MLLFKNARIIDENQDDHLDILVDTGKIKAIGKKLDVGNNCKIYDLKNKILMPAFIDLHAHFRDPGYLEKEDLETGSLAALSGGYATVNLMGNTKPTCSSSSIYQDILTRANDLNLIHIEQVMTITKNLNGKELINFNDLPTSLKFFSEDGKGVQSSSLMYEAMKKIHSLDLGIMIHAEDSSISSINYRVAEDLMTYRDSYLSLLTNCRTHFSHVSTEESLNIISEFKKRGAPITCEVTPHHFYKVSKDFKVNPPIRDEQDIQSIFHHIKKGTIDAIATDHAPHTLFDKEQGAPGMIGLETAFFIAYKVLVKEQGFNLKQLSGLMSRKPAKILNLEKGLLYPGFDADFVVIDLEKRSHITKDYIQSKSKNTPFLNETFDGAIEKVFVNGELKFERRF